MKEKLKIVMNMLIVFKIVRNVIQDIGIMLVLQEIKPNIVYQLKHQ